MILVTGATGNVGSKTVRALANAHHPVRALVRDPAKAADLADIAEIVVGDLAEPDSLKPAFAGVDRVLVIAPVAPELEALETNAIRAAAEAGVEHVVKLSNYMAGEFPGGLWAAHQASENVLRGLGTPWTVLRPTRFMSAEPFAWEPVVEHGAIVESTDGRAIILIDPRDVAEAAAAVLTTDGHAGKSYYLTSAETLTGTEIAERVGAAIGRPITFTDLPPDTFRDMLLGAGTPVSDVDMIGQYYQGVREGRIQVTTTVTDLTGRAPRTYADWLADNAPTVAG